MNLHGAVAGESTTVPAMVVLAVDLLATKGGIGKGPARVVMVALSRPVERTPEALALVVWLSREIDRKSVV